MNAVKSNFATKATVFVVDDEPDLLRCVGEILQDYSIQNMSDDYAVMVGNEIKAPVDLMGISTGGPIAQQFAADHPAVVITDYAMGRMTGMDLIRECRRLHPAQKIILISGTVDEEIFADAPCKPDKFLRKPGDILTITDHVRELLAA